MKPCIFQGDQDHESDFCQDCMEYKRWSDERQHQHHDEVHDMDEQDDEQQLLAARQQQDAELDQLIAMASVRNLGDLVKKGIDNGHIKPVPKYV